MNWEARVEALVHKGGYWLVHVNQVGFWLLLALACLLAALRLIAWSVVNRRLPHPQSPRTPWAGVLAASFLAGFACFSYLAVRPEPEFYTTIAQAAMSAGDCPQAILYYEPLASWGTDGIDVHLNLGVCYMRLGRYSKAIASFEKALALPGGDTLECRLLAAVASEGLGRPDLALVHLARAWDLAPPGEQRKAITARISDLRRVSPASAR